MELARGINRTAIAFRGYNVTNLGRTPELLKIDEYREILAPYLIRASRVCRQATGKDVDLVARVENRIETDLADYAESIAMIVAIEQAQLEMLRQCHGVDYQNASFMFGFSLGEIAALVAGGTFGFEDALQIPLELAADGIELAKDMTLAVLFARRDELDLDKVAELMLDLNAENKGVIGISTQLSPNSLLMMGTGSTMERLRKRLKEIAPKGVHLRANEHQWPPLHTPIVWEKDFTTRAARMLHTLPGGRSAPQPPILSMVTGELSYDHINARSHMIRWVDQTQKLWDCVYAVLSQGIKSVIHVGPSPNIIPSTFDRLSSNVESQTKNSRSMQALSVAIDRPWLSNLLPRRAALLRAPKIQHIMLEDWLLENLPEESQDKASELSTTSA